MAYVASVVFTSCWPSHADIVAVCSDRDKLSAMFNLSIQVWFQRKKKTFVFVQQPLTLLLSSLSFVASFAASQVSFSTE